MQYFLGKTEELT